jgi:D-alanyl-lipoteichoic acid acyltransferase DltB (MBOAT superfamily)
LAATALAVMATMLVAGLWHGTTVSFVMFGVVHGLYLIVFRSYEHVARNFLGRQGLRALRSNRVWLATSTIVTFHFTATAYIFFVLDFDKILLVLNRL